DKGLKLVMEKGFKNITVDELAQLTGISKGYFYHLFESKEVFVLEAIAWQMEEVFEAMKFAKEKGCSNEEIRFLHRSLFKRLRFTNFEDIFHIQRKVGAEYWEKFRQFEIDYFTKVLLLMGRDPSHCDPRIISNLSAIVYLSYTIHEKGFYIFNEQAQEVTDLLLDTLYRYTEGDMTKSSNI
ncbi:MAG TPA: TetR/AcrR family transcriptional regulator, partial [Candidatus Blautia stercoravium]|nr:TetR/AcrR family transcriptional regulator [Candidatus Blautia stercoravium]